ncbi:hypothetical protein L208DRAFT_1229977 [Tricholoma matsutake]|nr:hypothetical protein L208DRAFT_1229977 [Tricholoma matsutake 945]
MHMARLNSALSACQMPTDTKAIREFWGAIIPVLDSDGNQVYMQDNNGKLTKKPAKMKICMDNTTFNDESPQPLYFPDNHPTSPRCFKGMAPDFVAVESLLETHARVRAFEVLFLPKFHCELNFTEQCWGYAKWKYREFPSSSKEADLGKNLLAALEMVSLDKMCR